MTEFHAHSANEDGRRQGLLEHLQAAAEMARGFSEPFGGEIECH